MENATKIELELEMMFWHSSVQTTQGRQFGSWPGNCWPVGCYYDIHILSWFVDVQLQKGMLEENLQEERIVSISNRTIFSNGYVPNAHLWVVKRKRNRCRWGRLHRSRNILRWAVPKLRMQRPIQQRL